MEKIVFVHDDKKLKYLLIYPLSPRGGGKALADLSAKNVRFLDGSPYSITRIDDDRKDCLILFKQALHLFF